MIAEETWFAAQTNPCCEAKALHGIAALGWPAFTPFGWRWLTPRHAPSHLVVMRRRPAMPGYVFLAAPRDRRGDCRVSEARGVDGIRMLVNQQGRALPIRTSAIELLRSAEARGVFDFNKEPSRGKAQLEPGDRVKIRSGPFEGWLAIVRRANSSTQIEAVDEVFGRNITVELDHCVPIVLEIASGRDELSPRLPAGPSPDTTSPQAIAWSSRWGSIASFRRFADGFRKADADRCEAVGSQQSGAAR